MAATTAESSFTLSDGLKVYTQTWKTQGEKPLAYAFFLHGFSDHCNAYYSYFPSLAARGIEVFSFDQRGWGRTCATKAQRGLTGPNEQILKDIDELLLPRLQLAESQKIPLYLMGHSNGGGITLYYSIYGQYRGRLAGVVVQSPLIDLPPSTRPFSLVAYTGKLAAKLFPNQQMVLKLDPKTMSRDKEVCRKFDEDELCHDMGTLQQISDMLGRGKTLMTQECYSQWKKDLPLLVTHGSGDQCTDHDASKKWTECVDAKDKTFLSYPGWYHKLHAELIEDRAKYAADTANWILERATGQVSVAPGSML